MLQTVFRMFVLALAVLAPVLAFAQESRLSPAQSPSGDSSMAGPDRGPSVAVKAAPLFAQLSQGQIEWKDGKGMVGGVSFGGFREGRVALITEAFYARRGASNLGRNVSLNILEVPVLMRINVGRPGASGAKVYGLAGAALDINLRTTQQKLSQINLLDPNVVFGVGVGIRRVTIEARENIGLRALAPNTPGLKSRSFSLMVGYRIR